MDRVKGKVAAITGAARGQGRSHAVRLAEEGADIIAIDIAKQISTVPYAMATSDDLAETARLVESFGRKVITAEVDVRDFEGMQAAFDEGVRELGRLDIVSANAGIFGHGKGDTFTEGEWDDMMGVNVKGVWHTAKAALPHLRASGGGSIVITSSAAGVKAHANSLHYVASKHAAVGIMRGLALELSDEFIRVNAVLPTNVDTPMIHNPSVWGLVGPDLAPEDRNKTSLADRYATLNSLPIAWVDPVDVSNAVLWLGSDESRYVTGITLAVDAGCTLTGGHM